VLTEKGFIGALSDEGIFRLLDTNKSVIGILALHVDDAIGGGTDELHKVMQKVGESLEIGSHERDNFVYKGLRVQTAVQRNGEFEITLDGDQYMESVRLMEGLEDLEDEDYLPASMMVDFRSCVGTASYVGMAFRPDMAVDASFLSRRRVSPRVKDAKAANVILQYGKDNRVVLRFRKGAHALVTYSDAGGLNKGREEKAQGGRLFCLTDDLGERVAAFIHWESKVIQRKTASSFAAETLSAVEAYSTAMWLVELWEELTGVCLKDKNSMLVDNQGLQTKIVNTKLPAQKRLRGDLAGLRQGLRQGEYKMKWVPDGSMLADPMTKGDIFTSPTERLNLKKLLLMALEHNNTFLKGVRTRTVQREDVSRYLVR
jgi:hypothetical protein